MAWKFMAGLKKTITFLSMTGAFAAAAATTAQAGPSSDPEPPFWCVQGDGTECTKAELADPVRFRQVAVLPTGFTDKEYKTFRAAFQKLAETMSRLAPTVYSSGKRAQLLYLGFWIPGGALGAPNAVFGGRVAPHPIRGTALTLRQSDVISAVDGLRAALLPELTPWGVMTVFNSNESNATANAAPPSFLAKSYGIAKCTIADITGLYVPMHELAHAALNFLDEYTEQGLEAMSIRSLDVATPLALMTGSWSSFWTAVSNLFGIYDFRISEILAANGNDNVDVTRYPTRVATPGFGADEYEYEGGMFFGKGTYHDRGKNIMNSDRSSHASDDGFGWDHSASQRRVVETAFDHPGRATRPNDRLRNAGPSSSVPVFMGSSAKLLLFDADKHHHYQRTQSWEVQVGWYEREWKVCWKAIFPYPCYTDQWRTVQKTVYPERRTIELKSSGLYGLANLAQKILCGLGYSEINTGGGKFQLCTQKLSEISDAFLPTLVFSVPYQEVSVPTSQWMTKYFWRFRSDNGTAKSGFTGWASFTRSF